jgi:sigma-B regulation protein RsbU (phosphoserine phosphatase)
MSHPSSRILLVADHPPASAHNISELLGRSDLRFVASHMDGVVQSLASDDISAALILAGPSYFDDRHKDLTIALDALCERHIGTVMLTFSDSDHVRSQRLIAEGDNVCAVSACASADEIAGRLASLAATKPAFDQLHHENQMLRRFDTGLNNTINLIDEEMRLAARLQRDFLPRRMPNIPGLQFDVLFRPASYVSGDIYDVVRLDESHIAFWVADAVGHGMPAALLTIFLKQALQTKEILDTGYRILPPNETLGLLNRELVDQQLSMCQFVTMVYCVLDTTTLTLQTARAGHPLPFHLKANGTLTEIAAEGALLGVFGDENFELTTTQLEPGDSILLYSDGFESAFGDASGPINERYRDEFAALASDHAAESFHAMVESLEDQTGSLHPRDDLTALLLSTKPIRT